MLAVEEVHIIEKQVSAANIHYSHLREDLIDHICCDVEQMMDNGYKFSDAYNKVRERIGYRGLKKIQDDTFYLIDKTYRIMKKMMKTTGLIAPVLLGFGSIFKIFHWPGAGIILVLGFFVLCFLFLPTSIYILYKETKSQKNLITYLSGFLAATLYSAGVLFKVMHYPFGSELLFAGIFISVIIFLPALFVTKLKGTPKSNEKGASIIGLSALTVLLTGFVFKIMHWPGAGVLLILGNVFVFMIAIPYYGIAISKKNMHVSGKFIFLILASSWIVLTLNLISIRTSKTLSKNYYFLFEDLSQNMTALQTSNLDFHENDTLKLALSFHESTNDIITYIEDIKKTLFRMDNPQNPYLDNITVKSIEFLQNPFKREVVQIFMIGNLNNGKAYELQKKLISYFEDSHKTSFELQSNQLNNNILNELKDDTWPQKKFKGTLYFTLNYLTILQQKILLEESFIQINASQLHATKTLINQKNEV
jgi:hypothetical protein